MRLKLMAFGLLTVLAGCTTIPDDAPPYSRAASAPERYQNVYIYRLGAYPTNFTPEVSLDGSKVFDPPEKAYTALVLSEGEHSIHVHWSEMAGWPDVSDFFIVNSGPVYIKISGSSEVLNMNWMKLGSSVRIVPQAEAESELRACCRYIKPGAK